MSRHRLLLRMLAGAALAALLPNASCRQVLDLDGRGVPPGGACGDVAVHGSASCDACTRNSCCGEVGACGADPECAVLFDCLAACSGDDAECRGGCRASVSESFSLAAAQLVSCQAVSCSSECEVGCGGYVHPNPACGACAESSCCAAASACSADRACMELGACERDCSSAPDYAGCLGACIAAHPEGAPAARDFGQCLLDECAASCGDAAWSCLESIEWPPAAAHTVTITMLVREFSGSNKGIPGLKVQFCRLDDQDCKDGSGEPDPIAVGTTDETGAVSIEIVPNPGGANGYFEVTNDLPVTGDLIYPAYVFLIGPPITGDYTFLRNVVTRAFASELPTGLLIEDDEHGGIAANVFGCGNEFAAGVRLTVSGSDVGDEIAEFYMVNGVPLFGATSTTAVGGGGFLNVRRGAVTLSADVVATGERVGERVGFVKGDAMSYFNITPSPR